MSIQREQLARLERDASSMGTANHGRYVADAMLAMRDPAYAGDAAANALEAPLRALRLLDAMWGGVFAKRPDQRVALNEVGSWLETRLSREPRVEVKVLLAELGWLRRLAKHHEGLANEAGRRSFGGPGRADQRADQKSFGRRLSEIEQRRKEAFATVRVKAAKVVAAEAAKPRKPEPLPEVLVVDFDNFTQVREVRQLAAKRAAKKKEPKEALLVLAGRGGAAVGVRFLCSTTRTAGMAEVMERVRITTGAPDWHMSASEMVKGGDGVVFVGRLAIG